MLLLETNKGMAGPPKKVLVDEGAQVYERMMQGPLAKLNLKNRDESIAKREVHTRHNIPATGSKIKNQIMQTPRFGLGKRPGYVLTVNRPITREAEKEEIKKEEITEFKKTMSNKLKKTS